MTQSAGRAVRAAPSGELRARAAVLRSCACDAGVRGSEQVPGAGKGALTQYLERKWGFSWGMGRLVAGAQAGKGVRGAGARAAVSFECDRSVKIKSPSDLGAGRIWNADCSLVQRFQPEAGEGVPWGRGVSWGC